MANWTTISNTTSPPTSGASKGAVSSGEIVNLTLTNVVNGVWNGYSLSAANFKIGGGVESGTGTNVWLPFGGVIWDANTNISQVAFTDTGIAGDPKNTVNVAVTLESYTPTVSETLSVGIQEKDDNPVILASARGRSFSVGVRWRIWETSAGGSSTNPCTATSLVSSVTLSNVASGDVDSYEIKKLAGTVPNKVTTDVASFKFVATSGYHFLNASALPTLENIESKGGVMYGKAYSWRVEDQVYENGNLEEITFILSYTPPQGTFRHVAELETSVSDFSDLAHVFTIPLVMKQDAAAVVDTIHRVVYNSSVSNEKTTEMVKVFGIADTAYSISIQKRASLASIVTAASDGYYNFTTKSFQTAASKLEATIGGNGIKSHDVVFPSTEATTRYDIIISGLVAGATSTLASGVPTQPGDAIVVKRGVKTLTVKPVTYLGDVYGDFPSDVLIKKPAGYRSKGSDGSKSSMIVIPGGTSGLSTRLVLDKYNPAVRVTAGMIVTGSGVAHGTTVASVNGNAVTLSTASTIAASTDITFTKDDGDLIPFSFTIPPKTGSVSDALSLKTHSSLGGGSSRPGERWVGGLSKHYGEVLSATSASTTVVGREGLVRDATSGVVPGMIVRGSSVNVSAGTDLTVVSVTDSETLELSEAQSFPAYARLSFSNRNTDSLTRLQSIQAELDTSSGYTNVNITGYIHASNIGESAEVRIYVDDIIKIG